MKQKSILNLLFLFFLIFCISCNSDKNISENVTQFKDSIFKLADGDDNIASKEIEKLLIFEYQIVTLSSNASSDAISANLRNLGKDRWECFHIDRTQSELNIICKRRPKSYLRYFSNIL